MLYIYIYVYKEMVENFLIEIYKLEKTFHQLSNYSLHKIS